MKSRIQQITDLCIVVAALSLTLSSSANATNHFTRINELMAGLNGDSGIQFLEMVAQDNGQKEWGPNGEPIGRAMVVFFDAAGNQVGRFVVPHDPPGAFGEPPGPALTVLFATQAFADLTGITPDFIIPAGVIPIAGKVCFTDNPDSAFAFDVHLCLSYGGTGFTGATEEDSGSPHADDLAILGSRSLSRVTNFTFGDFPDFGSNDNTNFALATPTPNSTQNDVAADADGNFVPDDEDNTVGEVVLPAAAPTEDQGENLFSKEAFLGNGRTCATCHIAEDAFGMTPTTVAALPADDLLFMNELNVNTLVVNSAGSVNPGAVSGFAQPSDFFLGGTVTGSLGGSATVLAGSGDTYLVLGGAGLDVPGNVISDSHGNTGTLVSFTDGDLDGPTPSNGEARGIEDTAFLAGGRALVTENINGFSEFSFMRMSPNLLNVKHTAPYGLSGEFSDLQGFSEGAVRQHFPRSLNRVAGTDFRLPTADELDTMTAFMETVFLPADEDFDDANDFAKFATTEAQKRGRDLFFGSAKCSACHNGVVLASSDGQFGTSAGINENFNTGVSALPINTTDGLPTEQGVGEPANSREFSTRPLFGVKNTAPFFHDNSVETLLEAIQFYDTVFFRSSPAFAQVGGIDDVSILQNALDIEAFLEALVELPFTFTAALAFGDQQAGGSTAMTVTITNAGQEALTIDAVTLNGDDPGEFSAGGASPDSGPFSNGESRTVDVTFSPTSAGAKLATLELRVSSPSESWDAGVALSGTGTAAPQDVTVDPASVLFGGQTVGGGPTGARTVTVTNDGGANLDLTSVALTGTDPGEFNVVGDSGETVLGAGASRTFAVTFDPSSTGLKSAILRIQSNDPDEGTVDVELFGEGVLAADLIFSDGFESGNVSSWTF